MSYDVIDSVVLREKIYNKLKAKFPQYFYEYDPNNPLSALIDTVIELGDILNFYNKKATDEIYLDKAKNWENIFYAAKNKGYLPKYICPAVGQIQISCDVPTTLTGSTYEIDRDYLPLIDIGTKVGTNSGIGFITLEQCNFAEYYSGSLEFDVEIIFQNDLPYYRLKKQIAIIAGDLKQYQLAVEAPIPYRKIMLPDKNISTITNVVDSNGDVWYPVSNLAQDTIYEGIVNNDILTQETCPYYMQIKTIPKRFVLDNDENGFSYLNFGSGISQDELDYDFFPNLKSTYYSTQDPNKIVYNPDDVNIGRFLQTKTMGLTPSYTTLTISYMVGGGKKTNVDSNTINTILSGKASKTTSNTINETIFSAVVNSIKITNLEPTVGGNDGDTIADVKNNAKLNTGFAGCSYNDYMSVVKSMPAKFGNIDKVYISKELYYYDNDNKKFTKTSDNPYDVNVYILSKNGNGYLQNPNNSIKNNLKTYLLHNRMITDGVNILDAYIINLKLKYNIIISPQFLDNKNKVRLDTLKVLQDYFDINNWTIGQPIVLDELKYKIYDVKGVYSVKSLIFENLYGGNYSTFRYSIDNSLSVLYPSIVPSIFEIKYLDKDIVCTVD